MALQGQPRSFLGINLGQTSISLVELIDRGPRIELATYALADTPADLRNAMNANNATAIIQLARYITSILDQAAVSGDAVIFSLPASQIFSTTIELPSISDQELPAAIFFKAQELIPTKLDEMIITATWPGETTHHVPLTDTDKKCQVILSQARQPVVVQTKLSQETQSKQFFINAIPADTIKWYQQLAQALQLELVAVESQIFPIMRIHPITGPGSVVFVNIDQLEISLYVVDSHTVRVSRTFDLSPTPNGPIRLIEQIDQIINKHQERGGYKPSRIYLLGAGAMNEEYKKSISSAFAIPVHVSNPFNGLAYPQGIEQAIALKGPLFTVAVGSALRQINHSSVV